MLKKFVHGIVLILVATQSVASAKHESKKKSEKTKVIKQIKQLAQQSNSYNEDRELVHNMQTEKERQKDPHIAHVADREQYRADRRLNARERIIHLHQPPTNLPPRNLFQ